jgi:hypothetical protein
MNATSTCDMRDAPCDMRHATCAMRHAPCAMRTHAWTHRIGVEGDKLGTVGAPDNLRDASAPRGTLARDAGRQVSNVVDDNAAALHREQGQLIGVWGRLHAQDALFQPCHASPVGQRKAGNACGHVSTRPRAAMSRHTAVLTYLASVACCRIWTRDVPVRGQASPASTHRKPELGDHDGACEHTRHVRDRQHHANS